MVRHFTTAIFSFSSLLATNCNRLGQSTLSWGGIASISLTCGFQLTEEGSAHCVVAPLGSLSEAVLKGCVERQN